MDKSKLILPISILLGCLILGGFIYASQLSKQKSIEKQQQIELQAKTEADKVKVDINREKEKAESEADKAKDRQEAEKEKADTIFGNNLKCQTLLKDLKQRWNNVIGIYYSDLQNTCIVKYTKNGKTEEAPIEYMEDE